MCLIAGGIERKGSEVLRKKLIRMILTGRHRGPDGFGVWTDEGHFKSRNFEDVFKVPGGKVGLLQCRLGMTGSKNYMQPFFNELVLVHNGEVYNHLQIREFLEGRSVEFESDVDSEVILRALEYYMEMGLSPVESVGKVMRMVEGDYAVAFFKNERIYLFRDPVGVRPLYYSPRGFFASEKKILWAIGEEARTVQPGELVILSKRGVEKVRVFNLGELKGRELTETEALRALKKLIDYSTRIRCNNRVGVLFSGGLDSSIIAALSSRHCDVRLYTAGTENSQDLEWARKVSELLGLELREYIFSKEDVEKSLYDIMFAVEEPNPMNLAIAVPLYFATKASARDGVKVLLSGQGADELFGGYAKYLQNPDLMEKDLLEIGEKNLARDDKIAMLNGVEGRYPFLALPVIRVALNTPLELKIANGKRKVILRKLARKIGLPEEVVTREKKAAQYGSGAQKVLERLAKRKGLTLREFTERLFRERFEDLLDR